MDTHCARFKLAALHISFLVLLVASASAMSSDNEQRRTLEEGDQRARQLGTEQPQRRSLLKIFELENGPNGHRNDFRQQELSAQLQLDEQLSSESIVGQNAQIQTTPSGEKSLFRDGPIMRRKSKIQESVMIKSQPSKPDDPFATENPPVPKDSMNQATDSAFEPADKAQKEVITESNLQDLDNGGTHIPEPIQSEFQDAYTDELPASSPNAGDTWGHEYHPRTASAQGTQQDDWRPAPTRGTSSSSVSAVMSPRIRHTQNGIEVNFSDGDDGTYLFKNESLTEQPSESPMPPVIAPDVWQSQPQYQEQYEPQNRQNINASAQQHMQQSDQAQTDQAQTDQAQTDQAQTDQAQTDQAQTDQAQTDQAQTDQAQTDQAQTDQAQSAQPAPPQDEDPSWDSILKGGDQPVQPDVVPNTDESLVEQDRAIDDLDESQFDADDIEDLAENAIGTASEDQSIEKQREGYRQALRENLSIAPAQRIFQYLDDEGEPLPSSEDQQTYLLDFNSYRYSRLYSNECRIDSTGNCYCRMDAIWQTPDLCYKPLYFEEINLERFGGRFPYAQPVISAAHFFSSVVTLPYAMGVQPPHDCYYSAGFGRPGNKYCYQMKRPVWSLRGATLQSLLITGLVFGLP